MAREYYPFPSCCGCIFRIEGSLRRPGDPFKVFPFQTYLEQNNNWTDNKYTKAEGAAEMYTCLLHWGHKKQVPIIIRCHFFRFLRAVTLLTGAHFPIFPSSRLAIAEKENRLIRSSFRACNYSSQLKFLNSLSLLFSFAGSIFSPSYCNYIFPYGFLFATKSKKMTRLTGS
jgi:hypothetical protein